MNAMVVCCGGEPLDSHEYVGNEILDRAGDANLNVSLFKTLTFDVEPCQNLGSRVAQMTDMHEQELLVLLSLSRTSVLRAATGGQQGMRPGDVIIKIHGKPDGLLKRWRECRDIGGKVEVLTITRPNVFAADICRLEDERLGMLMEEHNGFAEVTHVSNDSSVSSWNMINWANQIVVGDVILSVNGTAQSAKTMINDIHKAWQTQQKLSLTIGRNVGEDMRFSIESSCEDMQPTRSPPSSPTRMLDLSKDADAF
eukprot:TRINITY_DN45222_c0_g1_i1.p1 TRINITY_DN45222_c0_g1~~TRINITY_DN45222_c0_g1_i1.p1  ORF type:complete len:254 (+),score=34.75 TRINITY_DN45222_c0_g1_i1:60-821(+)